ncbi:MAG: beta-carotene hydroxylase [Candidatus Cyclobacteriaceae bacterium M2_1C_046]
MVEILINILIVIGVFLFMEFIAWFTHKYIMHGILWTWHRSHHKVHNHPLERNDLFAVVFSAVAIFLFYYSTYHMESFYLTSVAIGILCYGIFYFVFHDVIVHRRIKIRFKSKNKYLKRIINAHYVHHKKHTKEDGEAFGFLYAPKKYEPEEKR